MSRQEFIDRLRMLLGDLSEEERDEAIQYYEDYFADAGSENEQQVIRELGSPEKVALMIREGLRGEETGGEYRETGYTQTRYEEKEMPADRYGYGSGGREEGRRPWTSRTVKIVLILLIIITAVPTVIPIVFGMVGGLLGLIAGAFGIFFVLVLAAAGTGIAGVGLGITGIITMFSVFPVGLLLTGIGCILFAVGLVASALSIKLCMTAVPALFRFFVNLFRKPLHRVREGR